MYEIFGKEWAALQTVIFSKESGFFDIYLEGDALQIVRDCATVMPNTSRYGHLVEGIKSGMQSFRTANIVHVKREANTAAHGLARKIVTHIVDTI